MKKITTIIIVLSILFNWSCRLEEIPVEDCKGETETTFEKRYNHPLNSFAWDMAETYEGDFIVCRNHNILGQNSISLMKLNTAGDTLFVKYDDETNKSCRSITLTQEGDFLICGTKGGKPYFARYDKMGNLSGDFTAPDSGECNCVILSGSSGRYLFTGRIGAANDNQQSAYSGALSLQGPTINLIDEYKLSLKPDRENTFQIIPSATGGSHTVIGNSFNGTGSPDGTRYMYFYKLNGNLNRIEDTEQFYNFDVANKSTIGRGIVANADGTYTVGGFTNSNMFVAHLNENGELITKYDYGVAVDQIYSIIAAHEADHYVVCGSKRNITGTTELFLAKISKDGDIAWETTYGQPATYEGGFSVKQTRDCGYIMTGYSANTPPTGTFEARQTYVVKVDADGRS